MSREARETLSRDARPCRGQQRGAGAGARSWQPGEPKWRGRQWCPFTGLGSLRPLRLPGGASSGQTPLSPGGGLSAGLASRRVTSEGRPGAEGLTGRGSGGAGPGRRPVVRAVLNSLQGSSLGTVRAPGTRGTPAWVGAGRMEERCWERGALSGRREQASPPHVPHTPLVLWVLPSPGGGEGVPTHHLYTCYSFKNNTSNPSLHCTT